jgi:hypothetical protein
MQVMNMMDVIVRFLQALAPALYHSSSDVRVTSLAIIIANVVPLLGVIFSGWNPSEILYLYWLESLIVGFFTLAAILGSGLLQYRDDDLRWGMLALTLFTAVFFTLHYGGFNFGHGVFLALLDAFLQSVMQDSSLLSDNGSMDGWHALFKGDGFSPLNLFLYVVERTGLQPEQWFSKRSIFPAVFFLVLSHGFSFFKHEVSTGRMAESFPMEYMMRPYGRIFLMHIFITVGFVVFLGGVVLLGEWATVPLMMLWIGMKLFADLKAHVRHAT